MTPTAFDATIALDTKLRWRGFWHAVRSALLSIADRLVSRSSAEPWVDLSRPFP